MNIAIEADRLLENAEISILLSGDIEIDGFGARDQLSWVENLEPGVNQLTLPIRAIGARGGQVVVRLTHPDSEQIFVVQLKMDS